jgi:hypothetical protein
VVALEGRQEGRQDGGPDKRAEPAPPESRPVEDAPSE